MTIDEIKAELAKLETASRRELIGFLAEPNNREDPGYAEHMAEMARLIDDKDPSHWLTLEEFDRRLSLLDDEPRKG